MFQFAHVEGYARSSAKKVKVNTKTGEASSKPKRDISEIIGEVMRDTGHCNHVENPQPPTFHFGDEATLRAMPERIERNCAEWKRKGNKTVRKDAQVLLTEIVSYQRGVGTPEDYEDWLRRNVEEAKRKHGDRLVAILGHPEDEEHPHLHIYVLPLFGENPDVKTIHPGHKVVKDTKALFEEKGWEFTPKYAAGVYAEAMRQYQTEYHERVGIFCGMTRNGAGGRRLTRAGKMKEKDQARAIKEGLELVESRQRELDDLKANMESEIERRANELARPALEKVEGRQRELDDAKAKMDSEIESRAALRAKDLARAALVQTVKKAEPDLPAAPDAWEAWKFKDYTDKLLRIIKVQASKIAALPAMQETLEFIRSEGRKVKEENQDLVLRVAQLQEHAKAWAIVQQIAPDVAREVAERMKPKTKVDMAGLPVVKPSVAIEIPTAVISPQ